jgi:hypothetical protein
VAIKTPGVIAWITLATFLIALLIINKTNRRRALMLCFAALAGILVWWAQVRPSNDRVWAPELARTVTGTVTGDLVKLTDVRDFDWQSSTTTEPRWLSKSYDLKLLKTVDFALSYWGMDDIAHALISFGFSDGQHVVFSAETRREVGESYSEIGGFFKMFELSLIAATEDDILKLRTNIRDPKEDVYLYPISMPKPEMRTLFLTYISAANGLANEPRWYNTITTNCSTVIYRTVRAINPDAAFDIRFLLSGRLPEYFAERSLFVWPKPYGDYREKAFISRKAQAMKHGDIYSRIIRND